jgi:hypothetical protein
MQLEKHEGLIDYSTGNVVFYKFLFESIFQAGEFLGSIKPGNYKGWVNGDAYGLIDLDSGWVYTNLEWYPPNTICVTSI